MTAASPVDLPCPDALPGAPIAAARHLVATRRPFEHIEPGTWDALVRANPWATPFSSWVVHRAWWDAFGANAHEQTLVVVDADRPDFDAPIAIVPLMHRHEVEADDAVLRTRLRAAGAQLTPVEGSAKAIFFGASYHVDYATILAAPADIPAVADAVARALVEPGDPSDHPAPWDVVDLRRLRCGDPTVAALVDGFTACSPGPGWAVTSEREDVCPVLTLPAAMTFDDYLGTLPKNERHEIRRKIRRAEAAGEVRLDASADPVADLAAFIDLHQRRWGADGLFPATLGGDQSRAFLRRLLELAAPGGTLQLRFLSVGGRRIAAGLWFDDGTTLYFYNAGTEPDARELSPGVLLVARAIQDAMVAGRRRFDFLRGNEPYKYEWGAVDEPIQRVLVARTTD